MEQIEVLNTANAFGKGFFGVIFGSPDGTRAYKLFRQNDDKPADFSRMVFESELRAHQIASGDAEASPHVPTLFGKAAVGRVIDTARGDISKHFMLDCCIVMERIHGEDRKVGPMGGDRLHVRKIVSRLHTLDVLFTEDISVFFADDPVAFKIIDFGMRDSCEHPNGFLLKMRDVMHKPIK